jgi:hypothetical protein
MCTFALGYVYSRFTTKMVSQTQKKMCALFYIPNSQRVSAAADIISRMSLITAIEKQCVFDIS